MKRIIFALLPLLLLASCKEVRQYKGNTFFAMNTVVNTIISPEIAEDNTRDILSDIESRMSRTDNESEIHKLNNGEELTLSEDTVEVIEKSLKIARDTDFAFNPCMGTLTDLWDITSGRNTVPSEEQITEALNFCDASLVKISDGCVKIPTGMKIDLGAIAKGYALQCVAGALSESAASSDADADFCISLGGNVAVKGASQSRKSRKERGWSVGITNPFDKNEIMGSVVLEDGYVSVSGAYERFFEKDGNIYHHIFDSKTGHPSKSDLASAVVVSDNGLEADALSTALFVMGKNEAVSFYKSGKYDFDMILIDENSNVYVSEGLYDCFTVENEFGNNGEIVNIG